MSALEDLTKLIAGGLTANHDELAKGTKGAINGIFGERYRSNSPHDCRIALMSGDKNVPFAGLLHPENPTSGVYGGMSLIWFPIPAPEACRALSPTLSWSSVVGSGFSTPSTKVISRNWTPTAGRNWLPSCRPNTATISTRP